MSFLLLIILFGQFTSPYETRVFLDADGQFLIYTRYYQDNLISIDSIRSVDDYLDTGLQARNLNLLLEELKKDMLQEGGYASKGLFGTFEIPLPRGGFSDFMGETGKLDVGGYVKITLGGSETFVSNVPGESQPSLLPELEMKQEMAISLDGQVGDRMRVYLDHNSERINESQNKITVTYMGREDDIIQEVEGGDTQLDIPATNYTGDIPSHSGLFGIKSTAKLGPLDLVAIASNEQTQTQEIEIEGSIQATYDTLWAKYYERRRFFWLGTTDSIDMQTLEVYVDDNNAQNNNQGITYYGEAFLDTTDDNVPDDTSNPTNYKEGHFTYKLEGSVDFYRYIPGANIIELNYKLSDGYVLGVKYTKYVNGQPVQIGKLENDTIHLKLICPEQVDTLSYTWQYERKNYYQVVSPGSRLDSLRIYYVPSGGQHKDKQGSAPYLELLGLDTQPKDGKVDENRVWFPSRGLLIFPEDQPFASENLDDPDPEIYTNPYMQTKGKYYIYKKTVEAKPVYTLPDNIVRVWVYIDDILQDSITDYHVDYDEGILEFKKPIAPTSKVRIKTEYAPFFSAAQKSLVGVRGSLRPFGDALLGSSFFYRTESYPAEHIRLREEPFNRMVWEVDFRIPQKLPFLTNFVDALPLVETETESKLDLNFETAYSFSDLNSSGEVWLDDLESTTILTNDVSISKSSWVLCSKPVAMDTSYFALDRLIWYNPQDQDRLQASDIYVDPIDPNEIADVLKIIYTPRINSDTSFAGLTQYMFSENLDENENLEIIIKGDGGRVHVDVAQEIDEDQLRRDKNGNLIGFGTLEDEDQNPANGIWTELDEDTGLDGIFGADTANVTGDDGNDDYKEKDYTGGINGTEGNRLWDTEDIDHNGIRNNENRYYSYSVHLDSTKFLVQEAGLHNGWKLFRISIKDSLLWDTVINQPDWHNIKYIRIWFDEFTNTETLFVYKLGTTGSRWKNYGIEGDKTAPDSTEIFTITPVNTKTHPYYKPPYPTEKDPLTGETKSEGGLELRIENVKEGHTCIAHRRTDDYEDYRSYDTLTFYIHAHFNPMIAVRIGSDSANYYEYRTEYESSGTEGFNDYRLFYVSLQRFTELKKLSQGDSIVSESGYTVVGNPSLAGNEFLELRIENQFVTPLNDTIWFNDVKLVSPKTEVGRILWGIGSINFADLASVSFSYNESNGRFKRLTDPKDISTESAKRSYSIGSTVSLHKFLPESWGFNIPVSFNYNKFTSDPRYSYRANDIELTEDERIEQQTIKKGKSYTIHISKSNSKNWFLKHTLDGLSFDHSRSYNFNRSVNYNDTTRTITYGAAYSLAPQLSFQVFNQAFHLLPQNVSLSAVYTDNALKSYYRPDIDSQFQLDSIYGLQRKKTLSPSFSVSYSPHSIVNTSFNFSQVRDSVSQRGRFGEEVSRHQSFDASVAQDLILVSPRLTFNSSYDEDHRFEIRQDQDLRNVSNSARYGASGTVKLKEIVRFFTQIRDETKDSLAMAGSPSWVAKQIEAFIDIIQNPTLNFSRSRYSNYLNVKTRPTTEYQWGLQDSIPSEDVAEGSFPGRGMTDSYGGNTGLVFKFLSIQGGYNRQISRSFNYGGGETRTTSTAYPNLSMRLSRLESLPFMKNISRSSSISSNFNQFFDKRYEVAGDSMNLTSKSKTMSFSPLVSWQSNWVRGISTTIDINYSETDGYSYLGIDSVPSRSLNRGGSFSIAYTFSAPRGLRIPLLGGLKFSSNLSLNLGVNYNRSTNYSNDLNVPTSDAQTIGANIGLSYNFSSSVTGGANFDYSQNKEFNTTQDSKRVGLNIWTNINF